MVQHLVQMWQNKIFEDDKINIDFQLYLGEILLQIQREKLGRTQGIHKINHIVLKIKI